MRELVIDSFAGGGGASEGIRMALGFDPDIAVNHDPFALAMHRINHPGTRHLVEDVVVVDAVSMCDGRPIGMLWMSPDCTDHSKAKGGAPRRGEKNTRGLAWAIVAWVKALPKWQRPRVIFLENVEEFEDWGPLLDDGKRCPIQKGSIFKQFVAAWSGLGAKRIEWRQRRAWKAGAATIRKRLYMIIRFDNEPITWPEAEFGNPNDAADAARIAAGQLKPWRTAADIIDFSLPCPSIFDTSEEIKRKLGLRAIRPLATKTMARVAKGTMRYVVNNPRPFIVKVNHTGRDDDRSSGLDRPLSTVTAHRDDALVTPIITYAQQGGANRPADAPLQTVTASRKDQNAVVMPHLMMMRNAEKPWTDPAEPMHTITAGGASPALVAPFLVPRYGEAAGQQPRAIAADEPMPTVVPTGNGAGLAAIHLQRQFGASVGGPADEPAGTVTAGGAGKTAVVAAFLAQHNGGPRPGAPGHVVDEPVSTIATAGAQQQLVAASMLNMRGSDRRDASVEEPLRTESAGGNHAATVYAFLAKYFGTGLPSQPVDDPLHTVTAKPRHGLVTVMVEGEPFVIVDIGMRMLTPRERFNAQGFRRDYIIDRGILDDGRKINFTLEQQGRMCGNSVCPDEAEALVRANYRPREVQAPTRRSEVLPSLFMEAAE